MIRLSPMHLLPKRPQAIVKTKRKRALIFDLETQISRVILREQSLDIGSSKRNPTAADDIVDIQIAKHDTGPGLLGKILNRECMASDLQKLITRNFCMRPAWARFDFSPQASRILESPVLNSKFSKRCKLLKQKLQAVTLLASQFSF
ncbi:hypothetical protein SK128_028142 [Halocaridina rubra]|uniref:Uncharacterized protein n=1 Tax=Halocaridina rubra TaxID=373956 RepID=A0AAN8WXA3_HALRR